MLVASVDLVLGGRYWKGCWRIFRLLSSLRWTQSKGSKNGGLMYSSLYPAIPDRVLLLASAEPILLLTLPGRCHPHGPGTVKGLTARLPLGDSRVCALGMMAWTTCILFPSFVSVCLPLMVMAVASFYCLAQGFLMLLKVFFFFFSFSLCWAHTRDKRLG